MINRVADLNLPADLINELLRVVGIRRDWVTWECFSDDMYKASCNVKTWLSSAWVSGADAFNMLALSIWLHDGPKLFRPSLEQCQALEQVEVSLTLGDYRQPYPALLIDFPTVNQQGRRVSIYDPFTSVLCHHNEAGMLTCGLFSPGNREDITTTIKVDSRPIEMSIQIYDEDCQQHAQTAGKAVRTAINACLCLVNYGCLLNHLLPKEVKVDEVMARENSDRGARAKERLATAMKVLTFDQEIQLHHTERKCSEPGEPTGRQMPPHWRRGHWRHTPCGTRRQERRLTFIRPVLVRGDLFGGDLSGTSTTYKGS